MPMKQRNYKQERKTAIARNETGKGSSSGDAQRHRARRKVEKKTGKLGSDKQVDHKRKVKDGGGNGDSNLRVISASKNMSDGGKSGSKKKKAAGGRKGALSQAMSK